MKVYQVGPQERFKPVELSITFETKEELFQARWETCQSQLFEPLYNRIVEAIKSQGLEDEYDEYELPIE